MRAGEPVLPEHPVLECRHPFQGRGICEVRGFDLHVELPGDAGRILQAIEVPHRFDALRRQLADVRLRLDLRAHAPADDRQGQADQQHSPRMGLRDGGRVRGGRELGVPSAGWVFRPRSFAASARGEKQTPPAPGSPSSRLAPEAQGGEAGGERKAESDGDADDEQQAEAADHGSRRELQSEEARSGRQHAVAMAGPPRDGREPRRRRPPGRLRPPRRSGPGTGSRSRRRGR